MLCTSRASPEADLAFAVCRTAATAWSEVTLNSRLAIVRRARHLIAQSALEIAATITHRSIRDTLVSEVLPLLDAMRFLERRATRLLAPRKLRGGRPLWLLGVSAEIQRTPLGVVLILGPGNYPLFLPCAQAIQALVAGNTVCLKPAASCEGPVAAVAQVLYQAGLPSDVLRLLEPDAGPAAVACDFDRIVLTGSAQTGIEVLTAAAANLTPATMELSGCDATYVLQSADVRKVAGCLAYGLALNGGATCIAPRRVFVHESLAAALEQHLISLLPTIAPARVAGSVAAQLALLAAQAVRSGARLLYSGPNGATVLANARCDMALLRRDIFAPWLAIVPVPTMEFALQESKKCPYALGASIFGSVKEARQLAQRIHAGSVCINDVIVPTADPRLPFGGSGRSGFGRTRGAEGLLEMTMTRTVSVRHGSFMPHLAKARVGDETRFLRLITLLHGKWGGRL